MGDYLPKIQGKYDLALEKKNSKDLLTGLNEMTDGSVDLQQFTESDRNLAFLYDE